MADDLIPPPSPAGRPAPDAMAGVRPPDEEPPPAAPEPARIGASPFRTRFGFLWGVLAGVAVCVAGVTAALVATAGDDRGPPLAANWSSWKPSTSDMLTGAAEIAAHVGHEYRLDSGDQLSSVLSGPMEYAGQPIGVAVRPRGGALELLEGDGVMYAITVIDPNDKTTRRADRERLILREGLELALYSFRYLDDITMVSVALPVEETKADVKRTRALFYRPGDLLPQLQQPLARTLTPATPLPKTMTQAEGVRVESLVLRNRFDSSIQLLERDRGYLVLAEPDIID